MSIPAILYFIWWYAKIFLLSVIRIMLDLSNISLEKEGYY
jgi:hypothetical protein